MADFVPGGARLSPNFAGPAVAGRRLARRAERAIFGAMAAPNMADPEKEQPVMLPFADKTGTGWHVIVRYHEGHERRIDGFATEQEALAWIVTNSGEVDK
jgi:hypothetical protein